MTASAAVLVLLSCLLHAWWNFVVKRERGADLFVGLSKILEVLIFLVPFLFFIHHRHIRLWPYWRLFTVGAALTFVNYVFLSRAYRTGDLSVVYPVSRAGALVFLPGLSWAALGERPSWFGMGAIVVVIIGSLLVQLSSFAADEIRSRLRQLGEPAILYAVLAAATVAAYSLWDQHSVRTLHPFVYFYAYTALIGIAYSTQLFARHGARRIAAEWRLHWRSIGQVAIFNTFTYLLVLFALLDGKATYVIALRQLSIAIGAVLGWVWLRETVTSPKVVGVVALVIGCALVSLAH